MRHKLYSNNKNSSKNITSPSLGQLEPHIIMKNNAMFLLDLASSADHTINHQRRSSVSIMPSVSENITPPDFTGPFGPPPPFQCLQSLGVNSNSEELFYNEVLRKHDFLDTYTACSSSSGQRVSY